jgi:hypothetical protein
MVHGTRSDPDPEPFMRGTLFGVGSGEMMQMHMIRIHSTEIRKRGE